MGCCRYVGEVAEEPSQYLLPYNYSKTSRAWCGRYRGRDGYLYPLVSCATVERQGCGLVLGYNEEKGDLLPFLQRGQEDSIVREI